MKAILICEDKIISDNLKQIILESGAEVITYNWFLKAIDNLDEIDPDFIIINTHEYPRHWKFLAQYLSAFENKKIELYLYSTIQLSEEDEKKATCLGIKDIISSFDYKLDLSKQSSENKNAENIYTEEESDYEDALFSVDNLLDQSSEELNYIKGYYIITNPVTGKYISGNYLEYDGNKITCQINDKNDFVGIEKDSFIQFVSYSNENECKSFSAKVNDYLDLLNEKFIVLNICENYEEK